VFLCCDWACVYHLKKKRKMEHAIRRHALSLCIVLFDWACVLNRVLYLRKLTSSTHVLDHVLATWLIVAVLLKTVTYMFDWTYVLNCALYLRKLTSFALISCVLAAVERCWRGPAGQWDGTCSSRGKKFWHNSEQDLKYSLECLSIIIWCNFDASAYWHNMSSIK
jgi:hypothetical protein